MKVRDNKEGNGDGVSGCVPAIRCKSWIELILGNMLEDLGVGREIGRFSGLDNGERMTFSICDDFFLVVALLRIRTAMDTPASIVNPMCMDMSILECSNINEKSKLDLKKKALLFQQL